MQSSRDVSDSLLHVCLHVFFGLWDETRALERNPRRHGENEETPHICPGSSYSGIEPGLLAVPTLPNVI